MPSPAAGKAGDAPRTPTKLGRKGGQAAAGSASKLGQSAKGAASQAQKAPEQATSKASEVAEKSPQLPPRPGPEEAKRKVSQPSELEEQEPMPVDEPEEAVSGAQEQSEGLSSEVEDTGDDATEKAGDIGEEGEETEDTEEGAQQTGRGLLSGAKGLADRASSMTGNAKQDPQKPLGDVKETAEETTNGAKETVQDTVGGAEEEAGDAAEKAKGAVEDTTGQELPNMPDLSVLKGLEVDEEGLIHDESGRAIGKLVEGDAEDLVGYQIGDDGEILDDDGDLVGRCELLPETAQEQIEKAKAEAEGVTDGELKLPDISILEGLTVDPTGMVLNDDGDFVGQLMEGDPSELKGKVFNAKGEILDDEGNVIGRARVHPDAAALVDKAEQAEEQLPDGVGVDGVPETAEGAEGQVDGVKDTLEGAAPEGAVPEGALPEDVELPGLGALQGKSINEAGEVVDSEGDVLARLAEGDVDDLKGLTLNDKGEVVDSDGNVLGKVELADGAADKLKEVASQLPLDLRILDGLKVNKKGKVLDEEGEPIGELVEGDVKEAAGKFVNSNGEVLDKSGNVIGRVQIVPGEAATNAAAALKERLAEAEEAVPAEPKLEIPDLDILDGLKVNKKGQILNEDGEPIGELVDGDLKQCAGKKVNDKGEVLDKDGNVIGRVKTLPQEVEAAAEEAGEGAEEAAEAAAEDAEGAAEEVEEAAEEAGDQLPDLSVLNGLTVNKAGKLIDANGTVVGELVEGDAKKLSKSGVTCDAEGKFWDNKGHVIGRAQTVPVEEPEEEAPFAGLEGLIVVKGGYVQDENGITVGQVVEGDPKKLVGRAVDEDGDIIDKKGTVVGHAERVEEEEEPEEEPVDMSFLAGKTVNKQGNVIGDEGVPVARLVEGSPKDLAGRKLDDMGQIWNDSGKVIGRIELIPEAEREAKPEGPFAGLQGLRVVPDGKIADEDENIVGEIVEGNPKRLIGLAVDEDGDIIDKYGNVKGHAEPLEEEEEEVPDLSILDGKVLNKQGFVVDDKGIPLGRLVEGNVKELAGLKTDGEGLIHNDTGKVVGRCELIPENERVAKPEGPFAGLEGLRINKEGMVEDEDGNIVGQLVEGNPKRLVGQPVDEDGDVIDKYGNVKGHAEPWEEPEEEPVDLSRLAGCTVNKAGNIVDSSGAVVGRVAEGDVKNLIGKKVDGEGQIWDNAGNVVGRAELVQGFDQGPEGPFAGFESISVAKDGTVVTPDGTIVGRLTEGDPQKLVGYKVDENGEISDKNGNTIGVAERWEPEEKERHVSPMSGMRVNKEGEVRDENGDLIGKLTDGDLGHCAGMEIDDNGNVVDNDGNKIGEVTLIDLIQEEEEGPSEEELQRQKDAEIADKMANICQQTLERIQPVCKQITEHIERADRTPRDELDEEELVNQVKPLIEEGGRILQECNGALRGLDPDGRIAAQAKGRAGTREATPEEYRLADLLKELTGTVVTTIDNAKKKIADMPHAKKKLNPLWALLTEPLFQILAAVGLLLSGVLGLVGRLLSGLGLGGLVNGLLGGLGINKLLDGLGLGSISEALGGGKEKKKSGGGASGLPVIGGLLGSKN